MNFSGQTSSLEMSVQVPPSGASQMLCTAGSGVWSSAKVVLTLLLLPR